VCVYKGGVLSFWFSRSNAIRNVGRRKEGDTGTRASRTKRNVKKIVPESLGKNWCNSLNFRYRQECDLSKLMQGDLRQKGFDAKYTARIARAD